MWTQRGQGAKSNLEDPGLQVWLSFAATAFPYMISVQISSCISVTVYTSDCSMHVCLPTNRLQKDRDDAFKGQTQSPYSLLAAVTPQQINPPATGSNQLQSAIRKLQQQKLRSRQFPDMSHLGQQVQRSVFILFHSTKLKMWYFTGWMPGWLLLEKLHPGKK